VSHVQWMLMGAQALPVKSDDPGPETKTILLSGCAISKTAKPTAEFARSVMTSTCSTLNHCRQWPHQSRACSDDRPKRFRCACRRSTRQTLRLPFALLLLNHAPRSGQRTIHVCYHANFNCVIRNLCPAGRHVSDCKDQGHAQACGETKFRHRSPPPLDRVHHRRRVRCFGTDLRVISKRASHTAQ
jgi:hypothetical protein